MTDRIDHGIRERTVLITGGAGFVGSHLAAALAPDNDVRVLDDLSTGRRANVPEGAELLVGDVRDPATLDAATEGVDLVFHEAALVSVPRSLEQPLTTARTNLDATVELLERVRAADARLVFASSAAVYGQPAYVPLDETHPTAPASPYGIAKLAADQYVRLYAAEYDVPTVALRYFNVYGPRAGAGVVAAFRERALAGDPLTVHGDGAQTRDFVHVDDVVRANLRAATTDAVGRAFNVGTGETVTVHDLAERVRSAADADSPIRTAEPRDGDVRHSRADTTAARETLGFEARVSLPEGLATLPGLDADV